MRHCGLLAASLAVAMSAACGARSGLVPPSPLPIDDASIVDARVDDVGVDGPVAHDASLPDAETRDVGTRDASLADTGAHDASLPDVETRDARIVDSAPTDPTRTDDGADDVRAGDADCDPFAVTNTISFAPTILYSGALFFSIESTGCANAAVSPRACNNAALLAEGMTLSDTCTAIASRVDTACGSGVTAAGFAVNGTECASGILTIVDPSCEGRGAPGEGLSLVLASTRSTFEGTGRIVELERDEITNGCPDTQEALAVLLGTGMGMGIAGSPNVQLVVTTDDGGTVVATTPTTAGATADSLAAAAASSANAELQTLASSDVCHTDPLLPSLVTCAEGASAFSPVSFVVNDQGLDRIVAAGPAASIAAVHGVLDQMGGLQDMLQLNFVGGATCQPCAGDGAGSCCQ